MSFMETSLMRQLGKLVEVVRHTNEILCKSHHILCTTDIRLKILMILMSWSTMNS